MSKGAAIDIAGRLEAMTGQPYFCCVNSRGTYDVIPEHRLEGELECLIGLFETPFGSSRSSPSS